MAKNVGFKYILETFGKLAVENAQREMEAAANAIRDDMKSRVPVKSGALRDSIKWKWNKDKNTITFTADAKNKKDGIMYGKIVEFSPKINKPFFYPALDTHKNEVRDRLIHAIVAATKGEKTNG